MIINMFVAGDGRHADSAGAAGAEGRSGAGLVGVHHDVDRRLRLRLVPGAGDGVPQVPARSRGRMSRRPVTLTSMPVYTSDALILRTYKLGEADRIVVFLTRDRGKKRGVAKGARRRAVAVRRGARADDAGRRRVLRARAARAGPAQLRRAARGRRCRRRAATRSGYVGYFAELIDEWAPEAHADERLYRLGVVDDRRDRRRRRRSSRWRGTSSSGCCGCRACIRRCRRARSAAEPFDGGARDAAAGRIVRLPALRAAAAARRCRVDALRFLRAPRARRPTRSTRCRSTRARRASSRRRIGG